MASPMRRMPMLFTRDSTAKSDVHRGHSKRNYLVGQLQLRQFGMSRKLQARESIRSIGAMMRKLDQRGVAALEFCLVAVPLFILMFAIFDLGRYAITMQSLRALANAGARATMVGTRATPATRMPQSKKQHPLLQR